MSYKTILIHLDSAVSNAFDARAKLAVNLASRENAHLVGVAPVAVAVMPGDSYLSIGGTMLTEMQAELDGIAHEATQRFERICLDMKADSFESSTSKNPATDAMAFHSRHSDIIVLGQTDPENRSLGTNVGFVEQVVFGSGKPVIVVPYTAQCTDAGERILIAWDGSKEAARATMDAIPMLSRAMAVEIVIVTSKAPSDDPSDAVPGAEIAKHLKRHGVNAEVKTLVSDIGVADTVLSYATDFGADLLVMGAYGHSRVREWVMGGVTRTILTSMTIPVLMSH